MISLRQSILWRRAADWLTTYHPTLIVVTGSHGTATTASAIAFAVIGYHTVRHSAATSSDPLAVALAILGSQKNPSEVTWFSALTASVLQEIKEDEPAVLILEIPVSRPGDIDWLAKHLSPKVTVFTSVGSGNLELFGSKENIAHEMSSFAATAKADQWIIVNSDDELIQDMPTLSKARALSFGVNPESGVQVLRLLRQATGGFALEVKLHQSQVEMPVRHLTVRQQVHAVLAAIAVAHTFDVPLAAAATALQNFAPPAGHGNLVVGKNKIRIIDDSFNATPESLKMSLESLRALPARRRIAIIADIPNLGRTSVNVHRQIGQLAAHVARMVLVIGDQMRVAGAAALQPGVDVHHFADVDDAAKWLMGFVKPDDLILVSGGAEMHLNRIVERLRNL